MSDQRFVFVVLNQRHTRVYAKAIEIFKEFPGEIKQQLNNFSMEENMNPVKTLNLGILTDKVNVQDIYDKLLSIKRKIYIMVL